MCSSKLYLLLLVLAFLYRFLVTQTQNTPIRVPNFLRHRHLKYSSEHSFGLKWDPYYTWYNETISIIRWINGKKKKVIFYIENNSYVLGKYSEITTWKFILKYKEKNEYSHQNKKLIAEE